MHTTSVIGVLSALFVSTVHGRAAVAARDPTPSPAPVAYYTPNYYCPSTGTTAASTTVYDQDWTGLSTSNQNAGSLECDSYTSGKGVCYYRMDTGAPDTRNNLKSSNKCASMAIPSTSTEVPCGYKCPSVGPSGSATKTLNEMDIDSFYETLTCNYNNDSSCVFKTSNGALVTYLSSSKCISKAPTTCISSRRSYKREDNFTAMLKKKGVEARVPNAAAAAPETS
ncbi:hypothetical protein HMN09_01172200 [Mycena chlorophos]|uniref:Uncharacterized protein n=1 Tax=Mycena chlorophos TaxID=658473 RepID=A0A8H6VZF4_MYCCL|nr:hypothetical protein HMN09_01172200 [Mycena chlorophos]